MISRMEAAMKAIQESFDANMKPMHLLGVKTYEIFSVIQLQPPCGGFNL